MKRHRRRLRIQCEETKSRPWQEALQEKEAGFNLAISYRQSAMRKKE
jgi:hypothetical protein